MPLAESEYRNPHPSVGEYARRGVRLSSIETLAWVGGLDGYLRLLDQTRLPAERVYRECRDAEAVFQAIRELSVRGAPAIGVAAAYGYVLGLRSRGVSTLAELPSAGREVQAHLASSRPTAVNLSWALGRMSAALARLMESQAQPASGRQAATVASVLEDLLAEAHALRQADADTCRRIGEHGARLIPEDAAVLTHCNAGTLATVAWGTALAAIYVAHEQGRRVRVYADETRPLLQGARLTAFELAAAGIDVTVLCDSAAAALLASGRIDLVIVGADRIAANGDTANKIGTYGVALAARAHGVPFYVAAPTSTIDLETATGQGIPIEDRGAEEVQVIYGNRITPIGVGAYNPAFDVTPAGLITGLVTEHGILQPVSESEILRLFSGKDRFEKTKKKGR